MGVKAVKRGDIVEILVLIEIDTRILSGLLGEYLQDNGFHTLRLDVGENV
jgi:hypothetical protein